MCEFWEIKRGTWLEGFLKIYNLGTPSPLPLPFFHSLHSFPLSHPLPPSPHPQQHFALPVAAEAQLQFEAFLPISGSSSKIIIIVVVVVVVVCASQVTHFPLHWDFCCCTWTAESIVGCSAWSSYSSFFKYSASWSLIAIASSKGSSTRSVADIKTIHLAKTLEGDI